MLQDNDFKIYIGLAHNDIIFLENLPLTANSKGLTAARIALTTVRLVAQAFS